MRGMLLIVTCATVGLSGCVGPPPEVHEGEYPATRIMTSADGSEVSVILAPGVAIGEVLDVSAFQGFRPGIDPVEAESLYGPPVRVQKGEWEESYHFQSGDRVVEVVAQKSVSSWDASRIVTLYGLRVPVDDPGYVDVLPPSIKRVCTSAEGQMRLTVASREPGDPDVWLNVRKGAVQSIMLVPSLRPESSKARASSPAS